MAIDPVSSSINAGRYIQSQPSEPAPDAREAADQQNDARRIAESDRGASPQYLSSPEGQAGPSSGGARVDAGAVVNDPEGSIQRAQTLVETAGSDVSPSETQMRTAAEAYRVESSAQADISRQRQGDGTGTTDVLA